MTFDHFDVVSVPFPFTDRQAYKNRPGLVLSHAAVFDALSGHRVMAMMTSAKHSAWPLDVPIADLVAAGLPAPSIVRFKLFALDHRLVRGRLGRLAPSDQIKISEALAQLMA